jgi:hypothetical protein
MMSRIFEKLLNSLSCDDMHFIGKSLMFIANLMTVFGVMGYIVRNIAHSQISTMFPLPTFWIPESFGGIVMTVLLYYFGFVICVMTRDFERSMKRF